ncbi:MAG: ribulose-phosphate 3-epimerase [Deltaproteobacteria bacterium]|nr:MAG: ribulose-phosphate 3-epimerase [Deltaproteobacteria bacterium]
MARQVRISPSILSADMGRLAEQARLVESAGADMLHVDVMDGRFVPNITVGLPVVEALKAACALPLDVHLMIVEPELWVEKFVKAGAAIVTVQYEASLHLWRTLERIKAAGARSSVSINPATDVRLLEPVLPLADMVLVMSVEPGFGGQKFIPQMLHKVRWLDEKRRQAGFDIDIQVDGGINIDVAAQVAAAGADILVAGSAIYGSDDPAAALAGLRKAAEAG